MSADVRAMNKQLDHECLHLGTDMDRLSSLLTEAIALKDRLANIEAEVARLQFDIIPCRRQAIETILNQLPLTQASPEASQNDDSSFENDESSCSTQFVTQETLKWSELSESPGA